MQQVLVCLKKNGAINIDVLDNKRKELVELGIALKLGYNKEIAIHVEKALDAGATREDILKVMAFVIGNARLFNSTIELLRILNYEENKRAELISMVDDVRE